MENTNRRGRVRKRAPNACIRCRQQKVKCSGINPCEQCTKRSLVCRFDTKEQKVLVSQSYIANLERRARHSRQSYIRSRSSSSESSLVVVQRPENEESILSSNQQSPPIQPDLESHTGSQDAGAYPVRAASGIGLTNPLSFTSPPSYTIDANGKLFYLGNSSNWSFGIRVLSLLHEKVSGAPLPATNLFFEGSTYDLGWNGLRNEDNIDTSSLPASDFAVFLINAVKFHCGRLFHMFDEHTFMQHFGKFHEDPSNRHNFPILWYVHYLIILAFGKAFIVRAGKGKRPPGAELFVQAMKLLPDILFLRTDPVQSVELLCCAALYLQCLDLRCAAYTMIGQAYRIAIEQGMHTDLRGGHLDEAVMERCREAWWTVYVLDRQMSSLLGAPMALCDETVTASLPHFTGSARRASALNVHVKISKATALILQTVYGREGSKNQTFLTSMKEALKCIADGNDERDQMFPLDLKSSGGICRLSAYLHLLHHQCLILATRPLLFSFWQKSLESTSPIRISSVGGVKSLLRVCVGSAQQSIAILEALQSQSLLESFLPFDREASFSSAVILSLASALDHSLLRDAGPWLQRVYAILDEMTSRGNLIAGFHKRELQQLNDNLQRSSLAPRNVRTANMYGGNNFDVVASDTGGMGNPQECGGDTSNDTSPTLLNGWNMENGLSGEQLLAVADTLDFGHLDWLSTYTFEPFGNP